MSLFRDGDWGGGVARVESLKGNNHALGDEQRIRSLEEQIHNHGLFPIADIKSDPIILAAYGTRIPIWRVDWQHDKSPFWCMRPITLSAHASIYQSSPRPPCTIKRCCRRPIILPHMSLSSIILLWCLQGQIIEVCVYPTVFQPVNKRWSFI